MAKPTSAADWQYIVSDQKEEIAKLKRDASTANIQLTECRKEIGRLKSLKLNLEDQVVDYKADISKWKTLYDHKGREGRGPQPVANNVEHQRQVEGLKRQLSIVKNEKDSLVDQLKDLQLKQRPDNPLSPDTAQCNLLRCTIDQRNDEIRRILRDYDHSKQEIQRLNVQLKDKDEEIARLRQQLIDAPPQNIFSPPPTSPQHQEVHKLRDQNRRLSDSVKTIEIENRRLSTSQDKIARDIKDLEDRNILLHQQNLSYEDDFRREKAERELLERRLAASKDENRNLQAIIDAVNQGGGGGQR